MTKNKTLNILLLSHYNLTRVALHRQMLDDLLVGIRAALLIDKKMRIALLIACHFIGATSTFAMSSKDDHMGVRKGFQTCLPSDRPATIAAKNDSVVHAVTADTAEVDSTETVITVEPLEASNANITLIRKMKAKVHPDLVSLIRITPDTLGQWSAPLSLLIPSGVYDIVLHKEGFKDVMREYPFTRTWDSLSITMVSFASIQRGRDLFGTLKWISAGIAVVTSTMSFYFYQRVRAYEREYNDAVSPDVIQSKRRSIEANRNRYKISTGATFAAISGFLIFWQIELSY